MQEKKILVFIDWFLPGYKAGGPIRSVAHIVSQLSGNYKFFIVTRNTDYLESEPYKSIKSNQWVKFNKYTEVYYFSENRLNKKNLIYLIQNTEFNTAYINGIYSYYFSILPIILLKKIKTKKIIIAPRGMLSAQSFSAKNFKKKTFLLIAKVLGLYKNITFQATNEEEKENIRNEIPKAAEIVTAPNLPGKNTIVKNIYRHKNPEILKLASIARISPEKNTLFALQILSEYNYKGEIEFDIYGSVYNKAYWAKCKKIITDLPDNIIVSYKGSINSEEVHKTFSKYHFAFMPSLGENFGHSMLEAMSAGCPIIISNKTPWKNLKEKNIGWDIDLNNKNKFISVINDCIKMNQEKYNVISDNAFKFAKDFSNNEELIEKMKMIFE